MKIGIVGLGLIGGSLAKAYSRSEGYEVLAHDIDLSVLSIARVENVVQEALTMENIAGCELILLCVNPSSAIEYLKMAAPYLNEHSLVIDCCGTKRDICEVGFHLGQEHGFTFAGGHPMAGNQFAGFAYSRADLFKGAPMVIVPGEFDDMNLLERIRVALAPAGFKGIAITTAQEHDRIIAFTSQLAHVVSNAFIKSPTARGHRGISAGSYRDLTRVAWLNPDMWTDLFLQNADHLTEEIDTLIAELSKYKQAIGSGDAGKLRDLLQEGKRCKEEIDGKGA